MPVFDTAAVLFCCSSIEPRKVVLNNTLLFSVQGVLKRGDFMKILKFK